MFKSSIHSETTNVSHLKHFPDIRTNDLELGVKASHNPTGILFLTCTLIAVDCIHFKKAKAEEADDTFLLPVQVYVYTLSV